MGFKFQLVYSRYTLKTVKVATAHKRTLVISILVFDKGSRAKVDELNVASLDIDEDVLILDVSVVDASTMAVGDGLNDLRTKEISIEMENEYKR